MKYIKEALLDYEIELKIIDANKLAEDSTEYKSIKETIYSIYNLSSKENNFNIDKKTKVIFDLLSIGKDTTNIKRQFLRSSILFFVYENPGTTVEEIVNNLKTSKGVNPDEEKILKDQINFLKSKNNIFSSTSSGLKVSPEKQIELDEIIKHSIASEISLVDEIQAYLSSVGKSNIKDDILQILVGIFKNNYQIEVDDISTSENSFSYPTNKISRSLVNYLMEKKIVQNQSECEVISKGIVDICLSSEYLSKIGISSMFSSLYDSEKLEKYMNAKITKMVIDTQILIHLICVVSQISDTKYNNIQYLSVKEFYSYIKSQRGKIKLETTIDYIGEVSGHLLEAHKLVRLFSTNEKIKKLGSPRNVFYNFYDHLVNSNIIEKDLSFQKFIEKVLGIQLPKLNNPDYLRLLDNRIEKIIEYLGVKIVRHPKYDFFEELKKDYENNLADKDRSYYARQNDIKTILYLSDENNHMESDGSNEPFLITWDSYFPDIRKIVLRRHRRLSKWHVSTPSKIIDRLSVMNFKINKNAIKYSIISLAETNFNFSSNSSFLEVMLSLFNKTDISDLQLAHKLIDMEAQIEDNDEQMEETSTKPSPLTDILSKLLNKYSQPEDYQKLVTIFEDSSKSEKIVTIIVKNIKLYSENDNRVSPTLFTEFEVLFQND